jgi:hypothetical protein
MNESQRLWWEQAKSDHATFVYLRQGGVDECHLLHYLQMATEKISKAYLWRSGTPPPRTHVGLMRFLKALLDRRDTELKGISKAFEFNRPKEMEAWVKQVSPLAYELQNLAPAEAGNGPNPEYPWPHDKPTNCPAMYTFDLWARLRDHVQGRRLLQFIARAVDRFDQYA